MEKKIWIVTTDDNMTNLGVATTIEQAQSNALEWLKDQYKEDEWARILEEDGYESREDLFHDMMLGMEDEWDTFDIHFEEITFWG